MGQRPGVVRRVRFSYTEALWTPVWMLALMLVPRWLLIESLLAGALSFAAWLYVRRR